MESPAKEAPVREETPTEKERSYGMLPTGVVVAVVIGITTYSVA
jgi:hypothetical protein